MPLTIITGSYYVVGYEPDGDSLKFRADDPAKWSLLTGMKVKPDKRGNTQLRLQAVDTLESHYKGASQDAARARAAALFNLAAAGIRDVVWPANAPKVASATDGVKGYIIARNTDSHGRPVAFAYAGPAPQPDGTELQLGVQLFKKSINYQLLAAGQAYPMYYEKLFFDLRDAATVAVQAARTARRGLWAVDKSTVGVAVPNAAAIAQLPPIFPKLFRRLVDFYKATPGAVLAAFPAWLAQDGEQVTVMPQGQHTHFDTVVKVQNGKVQLTTKPENLIFAER